MVDRPCVYSLGIWALFGLVYSENQNIWHACSSPFGGLELQTPRAQLVVCRQRLWPSFSRSTGREGCPAERGWVTGFEETHACIQRGLTQAPSSNNYFGSLTAQPLHTAEVVGPWRSLVTEYLWPACLPPVSQVVFSFQHRKPLSRFRQDSHFISQKRILPFPCETSKYFPPCEGEAAGLAQCSGWGMLAAELSLAESRYYSCNGYICTTASPSFVWVWFILLIGENSRNFSNIAS